MRIGFEKLFWTWCWYGFGKINRRAR